MKTTNKLFSQEEVETLFKTLKSRFEENKNRHQGIEWTSVLQKLESHMPENGGNFQILWSLRQMEITGGEPDVIFSAFGKEGQIVFYECAAESPKGRRSICYDREGLESRKDFPPANTAVDMAAEMGIELLTEEQYRELQRFGEFDTKTSSWIKTPTAIRKLGGAMFCDRRYGHVFTYHNGAQSYYGGRAFRGMLRV